MVTSGLFTRSNPTHVGYNAKHVQYTNVKYENIICKLLVSLFGIALVKKKEAN